MLLKPARVHVPADPPSTRLSRSDLVLLALAGAVLHAVFLVGAIADPSRRMVEDSRGYLTLAANLAADGRFGRLVPTGPAGAEEWRPELARTPAYPAVLAAFHVLTGRGGIAAVVAQHVLTLALALTVASWCARAWGRAAGLVAGGLLAVDLQGLAMSSLVITESLYGVALLACAGLTAAVVWRRSHALAALAGLLAGVTALLRPTSIALPLVLALVLIAFHRPSRGSRLLAPAGTLLLVGILVSGAWIVRNGVVAGEYTLSTVGRYNLVAYHAAGALARAAAMDLRQAMEVVCARAGVRPQQLRFLPLNAEENARARAAAFATVRENAGAFAADYTLRTANLVAGPDKLVLTALGLPWISFTGRDPSAARPAGPRRGTGLALLGAQMVWLAVVYALVVRTLAGIVRRARRPGPMVLIGLVCALYVLALSSGSPGDPRLRWPALPLLVLVAAAGMARPNASMARQLEHTRR